MTSPRGVNVWLCSVQRSKSNILLFALGSMKIHIFPIINHSLSSVPFVSYYVILCHFISVCVILCHFMLFYVILYHLCQFMSFCDIWGMSLSVPFCVICKFSLNIHIFVTYIDTSRQLRLHVNPTCSSLH